MPWDNMLGVAVIMGLVGLLLLIPLWPGEKQGVKVLRRWGVPDPTPADVEEAVRYLRRRRLWYPWLFLGLPALGGALGLGRLLDDGSFGVLTATLLLGGLIAEVLAQRPPKTRVREAALHRRGIRDFIPLWGLLAYAAVAATTVGWLVSGRSWGMLVVAAVVTALTWLIILLAVRRPSTGDSAVDGALRLRSARVAAGLGAAATAALTAPATNLFTALLVLAGIAVWVNLAGGRRAVAAS
ncbi:hypothetical protein [Amycolatopsis albispora]|uniref:Uncharacterized protein n=1 Tax=Amycolatopsis albispora TaxID=1804986 RepID=A0A344LJE6_9PSEU|nr:hypothetical protein [Amycolatopsis albispora]AXB48170.1 hypothetical protein A4R43_41790 [Amycolatopsis albispora]